MKTPPHVLTNVRLSLAMLKSLKHRAVEERRPAAAIVREAVAEYLVKPAPGPRRPEAMTRWLEGLIGAAGKIRGGPTDLAVNHDHYLYGAPRKVTGRHRRA